MGSYFSNLRANVGASVEGQIVSGIYRNEGYDVLHLFWNQASNNVGEISLGFCKHPNVQQSMSCAVK